MDDAQGKGGWFDRLMQWMFGAVDADPSMGKDSNLNASGVLGLYFESLRKFLPLVGLIIVLTAGASVIGIVVPTYYKDFFNVFAKGLSVDEAGSLLFRAIIAVVALDLFSMIAHRVGTFFLAGLARDMMVDLRIRAFNHVIRHSHAYYTSVFVGALVQKLSRFQRSYDRLADSVIYHIIPTVVTLVGVVIVLFRENVVIACAMLGWAIFLIVLNYLFSRWMLRYNIYRAALDSRVTGQTADMFTNQAAIEAHGTYAAEMAKHAAIAKKQMHVAAFTWNTSSLFRGTQELSIIGVKFAVFAIGIVLWMRGDFSLGMFMLLHAYVFQITDRLWAFGQVVRDIYESFADAKEMAEAMRRPHDIVEKSNAVELPNVEGNIVLSGVSFNHQQKHVINNLSVTVKRGERVALVGPSGAGKSTLAKLISRVYDVESGSITLDGVDIRDLTIQSLKHAISDVPQDPVLFHRSLMENIRYGRQDASDEEVILAAKRAHCHEFIMEIPLQYAALVGERGIKLSGGERQRVAIARALLKNAPVLVFDEATSSLDSESEKLIQDALTELMKGRTTITIAHRLSTICRMDRILVLDKGTLVEDGTHDELLAKKGVYFKHWTLQQNGFIGVSGTSQAVA
jgi:ATP-binding cassette subfamily B protein